MPRSVRPYTPAQSGQIKTLADLLAGQPDLPSAGRDQLAAFRAGLAQTVREDRRRAAGAARLPVAQG